MHYHYLTPYFNIESANIYKSVVILDGILYITCSKVQSSQIYLTITNNDCNVECPHPKGAFWRP